jgi:hypothetical protein
MNHVKSLSTPYTKLDLLNAKAMSIYYKYEDAKKSNNSAKEILEILETKESNESNNKACRYFLNEFSETELKIEIYLKEYNDFCRINNLNK